MPETQIITAVAHLTGDPRKTCKPMPKANKVLMVRPTYFSVDTPINAHMLKADGTKHVLDKNRALSQWETLRATYKSIGMAVKVIEGGLGLPDMCFCANQSLPFVDVLGAPQAVLSNMTNDTRHKEVPLVALALASEGYQTHTLAPRQANTLFEGMGDCLWLPGVRFLLGGYGHRTSREIYESVAALTQAPVALFELKNPRFYHLDTCLSVLNGTSALACKDAFTSEGWSLLQAIFPQLIEVTLAEADSPGFACNAHCPDEKHVLLQEGNKHCEADLKKAGFTPLPINTDEFIKSGGSVFCMKLMYF